MKYYTISQHIGSGVVLSVYGNFFRTRERALKSIAYLGQFDSALTTCANRPGWKINEHDCTLWQWINGKEMKA